MNGGPCIVYTQTDADGTFELMPGLLLSRDYVRCNITKRLVTEGRIVVCSGHGLGETIKIYRQRHVDDQISVSFFVYPYEVNKAVAALKGGYSSKRNLDRLMEIVGEFGNDDGVRVAVNASDQIPV